MPHPTMFDSVRYHNEIIAVGPNRYRVRCTKWVQYGPDVDDTDPISFESETIVGGFEEAIASIAVMLRIALLTT